MARFCLACENIRFSSLFVAGNVSRSLRGRHLKGKGKGALGKGVLGARETRGARPNSLPLPFRTPATQATFRAKRSHRRRARRNGCFRRLVFALRAPSSLIWRGWGFAVPFYFVQDYSSAEFCYPILE